MGSHNHFSDAYTQHARGDQVIADPGANGTFNLRGIDNGIATIASGTRKLPNGVPVGVKLRVLATGSVTITDVAGTTLVILSSGQVAEFVATSATTWKCSNAAENLKIADAGDFFAGADVEAALQDIGARLVHNNTNVTTVGAATLTAAQLLGGVITRSGSTAAYTDTTDSAVAIVAAMGADANSFGGNSLYLTIKNTVAFPQTISGGTGVTVTGQTIIPPNSAVVFLMEFASATTVTMRGLFVAPQCREKNAISSTSSAASPVTAAAGVLEGASFVGWQNTTNGAVQLNTRTAAQIIAAIPNAHVGYTCTLAIASRGDNTVTLTAGDGNVTVTNGAVATGTTRLFVCTIATATTVTMFGL